jgi:hypothetical protein
MVITQRENAKHSEGIEQLIALHFIAGHRRVVFEHFYCLCYVH